MLCKIFGRVTELGISFVLWKMLVSFSFVVRKLAEDTINYKSSLLGSKNVASNDQMR